MPDNDEDQVTSADQQKINQFSRLNQRSHEIEEELEIQRVGRTSLKMHSGVLQSACAAHHMPRALPTAQQKAVEELNDLGDELILLDDDEPIKCERCPSFCAACPSSRTS